MPRLRELTAYYVSNPGATITACTPATGDALSVRSFPIQSPAYLDGFHREGATKGIYRVRSPRLHDNVKGIHFATSETPTLEYLPAFSNQALYPQDTLIVESSGGAAEYEVVGISMYYTDLPGASMRLFNWGDIEPLIRNVVTVVVAVTVAATPTAWTDTAINTTDDLLIANTDYAVLGYVVDTALALVAIKGADTSNFRTGGPGKILGWGTADYFVQRSKATGRPCIPVINSANKTNTFVSAIDAGASTSSNVTLVLAQLSSNLPSPAP